MRKPYAYEIDFDPGLWQIQDEQDSVAGFWSQKATIDHNGRSYIAWFTTDIPVSDGPYIFYGLPGLIVKLYDTREHYTFTLKEVKKADEYYGLQNQRTRFLPHLKKSVTSNGGFVKIQ
ncbi:MAG: GLPGLI family protein [Leadbetterella sp.]|nr:GLPGLI family protein [Leadbetterella sp.]